MSKVIEFVVEIHNVVIGGTKAKKYYAKSYSKLLRTMPKEVKRKWKTITYIKEGVEIVKRKNLNNE